MARIVDVVEFSLGKEHYALDIQLAREIVEMIPITPLPRSPGYLAGIVNLRGEITNVINLNVLIGLHGGETVENQKIIVLVPDAGGGSNVGIIVDDVSSVRQVAEEDVDTMEGTALSVAYVKGIIKVGAEEETGTRDADRTDLIIWLDVQRLLRELVASA
ncbi:MAG: chemotaxis protein CheW [Methanoculleus sp.]|nr:chemotaxis protein CheW [Methanoculleus sp.]